MQDDLLCNATWIDFDHKLEKTFFYVEFFTHKYRLLFPDMDMNSYTSSFLVSKF